ncbi:endonuclease/exonuclease/phosphatase family protein [Actinoplanes sp. NPDC026623]|uniref:endonuclease/exonuclease/phosphatase family protein n=1 Tax=Actinoplanes sp. NPDC026623 TaxID=3155610 RepID=UPI0033D52F95
MRRLLVLLCAFAVVSAPTAAHASSMVQIRSLAFNLCGVMCNDGAMAPAAYTLRQIKRRSIDVASLQEVCYSQYRYIADRLPRGYSTAFSTTRVVGACDNHDGRHGRRFGVALIVKGSRIGPRRVRILPSGRHAVGMYAEVKGRRLFATSVHNATSIERGNEKDLESLYDWLRARSGPVLSAGDYNAFLDQPGVARLETYFTDADHADNEITFNAFGGRKIDYIFTSPHFTGETGDTLYTSASDHRIYLATAWL